MGSKVAVDSAPSRSVEETIARFQAIREIERALPLSDAGGSLLMQHGRRTAECHVLLHGLTNCPRQFRHLGEQLFARGASVVIPRMAHHGFRDLMTSAQGNLTAAELLRQANQGVDLACGLGERVIVSGLSVAGVSAGWIAMHRPDVDGVVMLAPFFGIRGISRRIGGMLGGVLRAVPNGYLWWDGRKKEKFDRPAHCYPRFGTHAIGEVLGLASRVWCDAARLPLRTRRLVMVLSESDRAINNAVAASLFKMWKMRNSGTSMDLRIFSRSEHISHDFIDPGQPGQRMDFVYPRLLAWMQE